jgi:hypothetical protein
MINPYNYGANCVTNFDVGGIAHTAANQNATRDCRLRLPATVHRGIFQRRLTKINTEPARGKYLHEYAISAIAESGADLIA